MLKPRAAVGSLDQGQFAGRVDKHIGVKQLQVVDDPTQTQWKSPAGVSAPLIGAYPVDDEGVRPKRVSLVEDGVLKTLLMRRNPTPKVALTNGHARGSSTGPGNLFVASSTPLTLAQLKAKLLEVAQEEDLPYGLIVRQLSRTDRGSPSSVSLPSPMLVYRLYPDGHEELARGLVFKPASFRVLKDIAGMGDDPALHNTEFVGQSVSVVAPSVLIRTLELVKSGDDSKPAVLPRPKLKP